jgi:hypothetical protein
MMLSSPMAGVTLTAEDEADLEWVRLAHQYIENGDGPFPANTLKRALAIIDRLIPHTGRSG